MRLMLGCGELTKRYRAEGWRTLDGDPETQPDILATVPPLPYEVTSQSWDEICAIHFIEHFDEGVALTLLRDIYEVLRPGGRLVLEQPNLEWICQAILGQVELPLSKYPWMRGDPRWLTMWAIFAPPHCVQDNELQRHRWSYTPSTLTAAVCASGWHQANVTIGRAQTHVPERDFRLEAVK